MGFNLLGGGDTNTTSKTFQRNQTKNEGQSGVSGAAIIGSGNQLTISQSDQGAIQAGTDVAKEAVDKALNFASDSQGKSYDFGRTALNNAAKAYADAGSIVLDTLKIGTQRAHDTMQTYTDELNQLAARTSTNNDQRLQDMAKYMVIAVVLLGVAPAIMKAFTK